MSYEYHVVDNWFDTDTEKLIWKELDYYTHKDVLINAKSDTSTAQNNEGPLAKNWRLFLSDVYKDEGRRISSILRDINNIHCKDFSGIVESKIPNARNFKDTNRNGTIVSYYEHGDYYKPHYDNGLFTVLIWFVREPRKFDGGELFLEEPGHTIECKHNRLIFFPSWYLHEVNPIRYHTPTNEVGWGRYTITHFFTRNF